MFLKNLLRRKIRTLLTILGISIGVAAIIVLGALANGLQAGYTSMLTGSKADLILSQPNAYDISFSSVDEALDAQLAAAPEVSEVSGMLEGISQAEGQPFLFVFGYPKGSFALGRYQVIEGVGLDSRQAYQMRGTPILLGSAAAEVMKKKVGDTVRLTGSVFRVVGIYQTGDPFEESGGLLDLKEAQNLLGKARQVSLFYIRLKDPGLKDRFLARVERMWPDLALSGTKQFADNQAMSKMLYGYVLAVGGLAIVLGGVGMMNAQLMSVLERTREIGVLRALGWSKIRILWMILSESVFVSLLGGLLGVGWSWLLISSLSKATILFGISSQNINQAAIVQAFAIVFILGLVGGLYPAWRASRMQPVEALRYEGGSSGQKAHRLPVGGMAIQSLWQRTSRTLLTLGTIGLTVGAIMAVEGVIRGAMGSFSQIFQQIDAEIMLRQANISDSGLSNINERVSEKIAALPEVQNTSGVLFTAIVMPDTGGFFVLQGYEPGSVAIQRFKIIEGKYLATNHQIMIGSMMAEALHRHPGDTLDLSGVRYKVVGIYQSNVSWEEMGGVVSLRDAQSFTGRPRQVSMLAVKLQDPSQAQSMVDQINREFPAVHASLATEFVQQMPDMKSSGAMLNSISILAILIGGVGMLNTMLMSVFERTREIGVLRALGWRRRSILGLIMREALLLGLLGGVAGIGLALIMATMIQNAPMIGKAMAPVWEWDIFARAILIAVVLGLVGGLYPAYRATRLQPVEALRYE